jgi:DNA-binding CsgD family transcriptional regulator
MNDAQLFSRERLVVLSRLNEAERRVLRLLAEGHTAKSIATELGTTPAAVNERLREARRKTGVGSSRELARVLRAQENRDEQIGVGARQPIAADISPGAANPWRPKTGVYAMIGLLVLAAGAIALMSAPPTVESAIDPLIGAPLQRGPQPAELHAKVRAELRDPWAVRTEQQIEGRLMSLPLVGKDGNVLRITCGSTICEIAGTLIAPSKAEQQDPKSQFSRIVNDLQVPPLTDDLEKLGLRNENGNFIRGEGKPERLVFLLYYSRVDATAK